MLRKASEAVSEGNSPVHQEEESGFGQPAPEDKFREIRSLLKHQRKKLDEFHDDMKDSMKRLFAQFSARLGQDAQQPRLAMEADGPENIRTRERTDGAATAVQAMRGDSCTTAQRVQDGPMTNSTSFGVKAEPPALLCRDDFVVESGDAAPRSCLPSLEMRSPTAAGGLIPTGEASTATRTTSNEPLLRFYAAEEINPEDGPKKENLWTSTPYASYDSSVFQESNLSAAPYCRRVVDTKSRQIGLLIQVVLKITSAPAHFLDRGARWFVVRLYVLEKLGDEL